MLSISVGHPHDCNRARSLMFEVRGLLARLGLNDRFLRLGEEEETSGLESGVLAGFGGYGG